MKLIVTFFNLAMLLFCYSSRYDESDLFLSGNSPTTQMGGGKIPFKTEAIYKK
jgi:hypothetical protein